ncbi:5955_t:CDS:2 [Ambispora gerdemannii]|uniref:5955_t:CDS:1 n=1 Tax=Ambispora gerdemannii TaxID=144530 RepID=A0A9N8V1X2_9GLOM|nr:5955_t:CDS:2 [Ambispora gerdemannii]
MDQLCINQDKSKEGQTERGQEVPKMRQYYDNGTITLIAIDDKVGEENGYTDEDKVEMTLSQALKAIKKRGRSVPVDGIYSILGLLPYGEHVEVKYNKDNKYTPEELNQALYEVMKVAMGCKIEPIAYDTYKMTNIGTEVKVVEYK